MQAWASGLRAHALTAPTPRLEDAGVARLLGLAFAGADLVFEIDSEGSITFALGAAERLTGRPDQDLVGRDWAALFKSSEITLLDTLRTTLGPGERRGPLPMTLAERKTPNAPESASLSVFRLPQLGTRLSCALSAGGSGGGTPYPRDRDGFTPAESFSAAAEYLLKEAEKAGLVLTLDLVEVRGLRERLSRLSPDMAERTRRQIEATLRAESYAGVGGAELSSDRFAIMRPADAPNARLVEGLSAASGGSSRPQLARMSLDGAASSQNMRTLRLALDRYIEAGSDAATSGFRDTVARTLRDSDRFRDIVARGAFQLAYQPVVSLATGELHHFEALARFSRDTSPAETIQLAEDLEMIQAFDLSVVRRLLRELQSLPVTTRIAANLSAHSLMIEGFLEEILGLGRGGGLRGRLILEITETRQLRDLDQANARIARLRSAGHVVCLDDFGAGAASLDYLRRLEVDFIKIDGRYIQSMTEGSRDALLVKHLVALCNDLGVATIAEMIETEPVARLALDLGVQLGQGWAFSKPLEKPRWSPPALAPAPARTRSGSREYWG